MAAKPNLRQIEAFKAVLECGSVSRAAEVLHISQPAVSKLIAHLEHAIGFALFHRIRGRLAVSAEGRQLYDEIERVFSGIQHIAQAAETIRSSRSGLIRIGVMPGLSDGFIQEVSMSFLRARPDVTLSVLARSSALLSSWLVNRQIDIAFPNAAIDHSDVDCEVLARNRLVCILPKPSPLARRKRVGPVDLAATPYIAFGETSLIAARTVRAFAANGIALKPRVMATNAAAVCGYVARGLGFAIVDPMHVASQTDRVAVRPFDPEVTNDLIMALPRGRGSSVLALSFAAEVRRIAKATGGVAALLER